MNEDAYDDQTFNGPEPVLIRLGRRTAIEPDIVADSGIEPDIVAESGVEAEITPY